ncbi:phage terminase large subunit family protein [Klebsiella pneumoniae]|nr:phage terminase large subunit family protein [Klebsiella pneumoniae]
MHFPDDRDIDISTSYWLSDWFGKVVAGQRFSIWEPIPGRANEALDCPGL